MDKRGGSPLSKHLEAVITSALPIIGLVAILDIPFLVANVSLFIQQYLGAFWGLISALVFLTIPANKKADRAGVPYYDLALALVSIAIGFYVAIFYPKILMTLGVISAPRVVLGLLAVAIVLETTRRVEGWALPIIIGCFIVYGLFSDHFPGMLNTRAIPWKRLTIQLFLGADSLFGTPLKMAVVVVFAYVLFGLFLGSTGGSEFFVGIANSLFGSRRGGAAKAAVVASMLLGGFSASAVGNVATIGIVTIPMMIRAGYPRTFAAAVEAVSGTGDLIIPPIMGTAAFIMPEFLGVPYGTVALAALIPGVLYYLGDFMQIDLRAAKIGLSPIPPEQIPTLRKVLSKGWYFLIPIALLVYCIFVLFLRPELAALVSSVSLLSMVAFSRDQRQLLRPGNIMNILRATSKFMTEITVVCAAAGFVVGLVTYTGLGSSLAFVLTEWSQGNLLLLAIFTAIASTILGMGMPVTPCYILLATVAAPAMVKLGVTPLLAHLFVYYFGTFSFLTPPVCLAVYTSASIAGAPVMKSGFQAMKLAIAGYLVPFFFLYKPALGLLGTPSEIVAATIEGIVATVLISMAVEGYFTRPMGWVERALLFLAGLGFFAPGWKSTAAACLVAVPVLIVHWAGTRRALERASRQTAVVSPSPKTET